MTIGAEIYNEDGKLYYSTLQAKDLSIVLHSKLINARITTTLTDTSFTFSTIQTDIPNNYVCLAFVAYKSGAKYPLYANKGANGYWILCSDGHQSATIPPNTTNPTTDSYFDVYLFSNYKRRVPDSGYGIVFYDENGVPIFNQDSKNLNLLTVENRSPIDGWFSMPYPTATLPTPTKFHSQVDGFLTSYTAWIAIGEGNGVGKVTTAGVGAIGAMDSSYNKPILHINTSQY